MTEALYPPSPVLSDTSFLEPSTEFKSKTTRVIIGIVLFILLYILLIFFGVGLLIVCVLAGVAVFSIGIGWITIVVALGLFGLGVMCFLFTIKFLFSSTKEEEPLQVEIKEKDHPVLFDFIRKLSIEVGTVFPRKIFLIPDVNASVSYNSSFWSMFLPVRKNLRIGLGLVNSLNLSEFKATVAHEFGHFSQRSMKTGSYVYTMNKVIYNLAYQYDSYDQLLEGWSEAGGILSFFAWITSWIVEGVRWILRASYGRLNITYLALSREMEYHADLVACAAAGNQAMVNTLRKIEFAGAAYGEAMDGVNKMAVKRKKKITDVYQYHSKLMSRVAANNKLGMSNGMPVITSADLSRNVMPSRLMWKDQWASHPSREEREASIGRYTMSTATMEESAWTLFTNPEVTRQKMTEKLYVEYPRLNELTDASGAEVDEHIRVETARVTVSPTFHGLYDNRWISKFDVNSLSFTQTDKNFGQLINAEAGNLVRRYQRDVADLEQVRMIAQKNIRVAFFEYDDVRYKAWEANGLLMRIETEIKKQEEAVKTLDKEIFQFFLARAREAGQADEFLKLYKTLDSKRTDLDIATDFAERMDRMVSEMSQRQQWREDNVRDLCRRTNGLEQQVKNFMREIPPDHVSTHFPEPDKVFKYLKTDSLWNRSETEFSQEAFGQLHLYVGCALTASGDVLWDATKAIYDKQLSLTPQEFVINE